MWLTCACCQPWLVLCCQRTHVKRRIAQTNTGLQPFVPTVPADLGSFGDAARAYEQAGDVAAAVRVLLERLRDAEAAAELAKRAGSKEASLAVAHHCEQAGLSQLAMEQYLLAGESSLAFWLAKRAGAVPAFAAWARQAGDAAAALLAAEDFEAQGSLAVAAELCALAGQAERATRLYIQVGLQSGEEEVAMAQGGRTWAAFCRCWVFPCLLTRRHAPLPSPHPHHLSMHFAGRRRLPARRHQAGIRGAGPSGGFGGAGALAGRFSGGLLGHAGAVMV